MTRSRFWGNPWIGTVLRVVLALVVLYAGAIKLFEPDGARDAIVAYRIFSGSIPSILGWVLPVVEVVLGLLLLIGLFVRWTALATGLLMAGFIAGIASVWARGYDIDCGCFGGGGDITSDGRNLRYSLEILRDLLFVGMSAWLVAWPGTRLALEPSTTVTPYGGHDEEESSDE